MQAWPKLAARFLKNLEPSGRLPAGTRLNDRLRVKLVTSIQVLAEE